MKPMKRMCGSSLLLWIGVFALAGCQEDLEDSGLFEARVKPGRMPDRTSPGNCKIISRSSQHFFQDQVTGSEREVYASELKARLDTAQPTVIVDVRTPPEYSAAHIPTSVNLPLDQLFNNPLCPGTSGRCCDDDRLQVAAGGNDPQTRCQPPVLPIDGTPIVLVSSNGHAASMAAGALGTMGYNVYVLRFGMISWAASSDVKIHRTDRTQRIQGLGGPLEL